MVGRIGAAPGPKSRAQPAAGAGFSRSMTLRALGDRGAVAVDGLVAGVRPGEIVGLAGVQGNGQDELVESIAGLRRPVAAPSRSAAARRHLATRARPRRRARLYPGGPRARRPVAAEPIWENMALGHLAAFRRGPFLAADAAKRRGARADPRVRRARRNGRDTGRIAVGRQPAEGSARARADARDAADHRRTALAGRRHRRNRGHPSNARRRCATTAAPSS